MLLDELFTSSPMAPRATIMHWHALTILRLKSYLHSFLGGKIWVGSCMGLSKYAIPDSIHWGGPPFETNSYPIGVHPFSFGKSPIYGWSIQKQFLIILRCPKFSDKPIMFPSCIACAYYTSLFHGGVRKWGVPNCWIFFWKVQYIYTLNKINGWFGDTMTKRTPHNHPSRMLITRSATCTSAMGNIIGLQTRRAMSPWTEWTEYLSGYLLRGGFRFVRVIPPNHPRYPSHGWLF